MKNFSCFSTNSALHPINMVVGIVRILSELLVVVRQEQLLVGEAA
jgi:hypothetical protein